MTPLALPVLLAVLLPPAACGPSAGPAPPAAAAPAAEPAVLGEFDHEHALWTKVLAAHVHGDRFDYAALKRDRADLDAYLARLHAVTPAELETWTREQRFAFWINVYNAHTIELIVDHYPVDSIEDIGGKLFGRVWDQEFIPMNAFHPGGEDDPLSLDDVEHGILRPRFEDARVHVAVNCASISCPPLRAEAFVAERLDEQLDDQARRFVADGRRNVIDRAKGELRLSSIFDWFGDDFERDAGSVRGWVARYASEADAAWIRSTEPRIRFLDYSWKLNDVPHEE